MATVHLGEPPTAGSLRALEPVDLRAFLAQRRGEGLGAAAAAREMSAVRAFLRFLADEEGEPATLPRVRAPKRPRTLPRPGARVDELMFAFASCQDYASGYYSPYAHMANDDLDFVVHLGDYVYEGGIPAGGGHRKKKNSVPAVAQKAPVSLEQWRYRYSLYKRDPQL